MRIRFNRALIAVGFPSDWYLTPLAGVIGALAGLAAVGFDWLIERGGNFLFGAGARHNPFVPENIVLLLLPAAGGLAVGIVQQYIARTGPTHGVPDVIESLARRHGKLPARVGIFKTITASLTIGTGGSAGVEGPIIQIGSVIGSVVGQAVRVGREHMNTLVGAGAAAGLAAIFNAPIAGVLLVLEVMLRDFSFKTFIPIVVASVIGTAVEQAIHGSHALFMVPETMRNYQAGLPQLWAYALLGVLAGFVGVAFSLGLHKTQHWVARWLSVVPKVFRPAVGGLLLGVLGVVFLTQVGRSVASYEPPPFYANGYTVVEALLNPASYGGTQGGQGEETRRQGDKETRLAAERPRSGARGGQEVQSPKFKVQSSDISNQTSDIRHSISAPSFVHTSIAVVIAILVLKLVGTCLTLGSGGSGGIFAPSLFMGTALGGGFGLILQALHLIPPDATPATYALAGMAGVLAAAVHCPLTAFILVFELTQDYKLILPAMLVAILATAMSQLVSRDSIYTATLRARGIRMGTFSDMTLLRRLDVSHVPLTPAVLVHPQEPAQRLIELAEEYAAVDYVVVDDDEGYVGMVVGEEVRATLVQREAVPLMIVGELMRTNLPTATRAETLDVVLDKFSRHDVASLAVVEDGVVKGVITRSRLMRQYHRALENA